MECGEIFLKISRKCWGSLEELLRRCQQSVEKNIRRYQSKDQGTELYQARTLIITGKLDGTIEPGVKEQAGAEQDQAQPG